MSQELKDGWNGPIKLTVKASYGKGLDQSGQGIQWKGKYAPHKDMLQWDTLFVETGNIKVTVCAAVQPAAGAVFEDAWIEQTQNKNKPEYPFRTMFTKEEKAAKSASGGGRFGGGPSTNLSKAEEVRVHALMVAATLIGSAVDANGVKIPVKKEGVSQIADYFEADILAAGKKSEPQA